MTGSQVKLCYPCIPDALNSLQYDSQGCPLQCDCFSCRFPLPHFFFSYSSTLTGILASSCILFFKLLSTGECSSLCRGRLIQFLCSATPIHPSNATSKVTSFLGSSLTATGSCTRSSELLRIVLSYTSGSQKEVLSPFFAS